MKAIIQDRYGGPEVLRIADIPEPQPTADQVRVRVAAAGLDRGVWHLMAGRPYLIRVMGYGLRRPRTPVPGMDVAGRVEAVGAAVSTLRVGDEVYGEIEGSFAECVVAPANRLSPKPASLDFEQAAAVPVSARTALQAVRDEARVRPGQQLLVVGASGGVGSYAVEVAKAFGAVVTGVCSASKAALVRSLGADHVLDYAREDLGAEPRRFDVILDIAGNRPLSRLRRVLRPDGTLVIVGGEGGGRWFGGIDRQLRAMLLSAFVRQRLRAQFPSPTQGDLAQLGRMIDDGLLRPVVDRSFALEHAADAMRYLLAGHARGKVVITL